MHTRYFALLLICSGLLGPYRTEAQATPTRVTDQNRTGDLPFSTSVGTDIERVDLATGALNVKIPLIKIPGRGMDGELYLRFNSNYLVLVPLTNSVGRSYYQWMTENPSGWLTNNTYHSTALISVACSDYPHETNMRGDTNYIYTDPSGAKYPIAMQYEIGGCAPTGYPSGNPQAGPDLTGQGMWSSTSGFPFTTLLPDGSSENLEDSNGNQETPGFVGYYGGAGQVKPVDTLGRNFYTAQASNYDPTDTFPMQITYTYTDSNGNPQIYTLNWGMTPISTNFQVPHCLAPPSQT